jgi:aspartate dehydrogenase
MHDTPERLDVNAMPATRRFALIGAGRIALPVIQAWRDGQLPGWELASVLTRSPRRVEGVHTTIDAMEFFAHDSDLIVETAGPAALALHACDALARADVWTVSAAALADPQLLARVESAAAQSGHRLRLLHGAIAGLDGVAAACVDPNAVLHLQVDLPPGGGPPGVVFRGTVREAARLFPNSVNVAVSVAFAGAGLDRTTIEVSHPDPAMPQRLAFSVTSVYGTCTATTSPLVGSGIHPVAASVIAALRNAMKAVWT